MDAQLIDPRDSTGEIDQPAYRVEIRSRDESRIDTWRLSGASDAQDAIMWAQNKAGRSRSTVYVEFPGIDGITLLRVFGDPDDPTPAGRPARAAGDF